ncbi:hypothetical protein L2E82_02078 [Cichorium intybus]|uniref:Uncharacterized protein n=1 Tax=Cichorium intybus TaxID=13427 RepID=A0ACB9H1U7_CICIN|nr:hypothetical protein L2E82_02078 [Cichorium intybus]
MCSLIKHGAKLNTKDSNVLFLNRIASHFWLQKAIDVCRSICPPDCFKYKGTPDVFYKIIHQKVIMEWNYALVIPTVGMLS